MLEAVAHWNNLSTPLREKLEEKINSLGSKAVFRFRIERENPDPEKYNGQYVYPGSYTLDPRTFNITDKDEVKGKPKVKSIGIIKDVDKDGKPTSFGKVSIKSGSAGRLNLNLEKEEDKELCALLLLHPKLKGGMFADSAKQQVFELIDLKQEAKAKTEKANAEFTAWSAARAMTDAQVKEYAAAMSWDETMEIEILRSDIEQEAKSNPEMFVDIVNTKTIKVQATVKRALDAQIISFDPVTGKYTWTNNGSTIITLGQSDGRSDVERIAEYFMTGGKEAEAAYKKVESLLK